MLANSRSITSARDMRKNLTPPEARLWNALRGRALDGLKFRRQHPIGPFILLLCKRASRGGGRWLDPQPRRQPDARRQA